MNKRLNTEDATIVLPLQHNVDLSELNSFRFTQLATDYVEVDSAAGVAAAGRLAFEKQIPMLALGGGSNLVLTQDFDGLVIRQVNKDIRYQAVSQGTCHVTASAGVEWHALVRHTVGRGLRGLENLALIPGTVGAAPVQNIGAYGVELSDRFVSLSAFHLPSMSWCTLDKAACQFAYRDSLFKQKDQEYIITSVTLELGNHLELQTSYKALADYLEGQKTSSETAIPSSSEHGQFASEHSVGSVFDAVCAIRRSKLPDPAVLPNAGSFFHNPVVSAEHFQRLRGSYTGLVAYAQPRGDFKLAAGWLIDHLGLKGYRHAGVGVHEQQALVLINYSQRHARELLELADMIKARVKSEFDVTLSIEPRII